MQSNGAVLITGASDGIGRALAIAFAKRGFSVGLMARREEKLQQVAEECRQAGAPDAAFIRVDVTDSPALRNALGELDQKLGQARIFIANAGINQSWSPNEDDGARALKLLDVNLSAAVDGIEYMKALFVQRGAGHLVGICSIAGARGSPGSPIYCTSKAALITYLEALGLALSRYGVKATAILPGYIETPLISGHTAWMPFLMKADRAAEIFAKGILRGKAMVIAPWQFYPIYWILKRLPDYVYRMLGTIAPALLPKAH